MEIGRTAGLFVLALAGGAACGTSSAGGTSSQRPSGWDGAVDALAQSVILSTTGAHEIALDPSQVGGYSWQYDAQQPNPQPMGFMYGVADAFLTCDLKADCSQAIVEISDFRVWLHGSGGWSLAESGSFSGSTEAENLAASTGTNPTIVSSNDAGTDRQVQVPNLHTYAFFLDARFTDTPGFDGKYVVAVTARVLQGGPNVKFGLMVGMNWASQASGGTISGGGLGRYVALWSEPTIVGYTNVAPATLLADPPAQQ